MFCPECGHQNPDTAKFCIRCGCNFDQTLNFVSSAETIRQVERLYNPAYISSSRTETSLASQNIVTKDSKKKKSFAPIVVFALLLSLVVVVFIMNTSSYPNYNAVNSSSSYTNSIYSNPNDSSQDSEPQTQSQSIVSQAFSLKAGEFDSYKFTIPQSSGGGTVVGNFVASGGGDDIYVVITNETGLTNIKSGNSYKAYYNSGKVTTDDINVNLSPGTYYIVFSNAHSILTPKAVNADISVAY